MKYKIELTERETHDLYDSDIHWVKMKAPLRFNIREEYIKIHPLFLSFLLTFALIGIVICIERIKLLLI